VYCRLWETATAAAAAVYCRVCETRSER
jgi:hypothetical protein